MYVFIKITCYHGNHLVLEDGGATASQKLCIMIQMKLLINTFPSSIQDKDYSGVAGCLSNTGMFLRFLTTNPIQ
jgi:hypothetical protein